MKLSTMKLENHKHIYTIWALETLMKLSSLHPWIHWMHFGPDFFSPPTAMYRAKNK